MSEQQKISKVSRLLHNIYPAVIGVIATAIVYHYDLKIQFNGFVNVINSSITLASIIVGFMGALLGILITIKNGAIVKELTKYNEMKTLKRYFNETFLLSFLLILASSILYAFENFNAGWARIIFLAWTFIIATFFPTVYRVISVLMVVFFTEEQEHNNERPASNELQGQPRVEMKERLTKK